MDQSAGLSMVADDNTKYKMTISRMTVDKLGVKLYDKVSAVIAELVANGYDADAEQVTIEAPMGKFLASISDGNISDNGYTITVHDNGHGMQPNVVNDFFLKVGGERRKDSRGDKSLKFNRSVMGRKGVGKLAPFGICEELEVISSGGNKIFGLNHEDKEIQGYLTAHFRMKLSDILNDEEKPYLPKVGPLDETLQPNPGTKIILSKFYRRKVPDMKTFSRQLAYRFGLASENWKIKLVDTNTGLDPNDNEMFVGGFNIDTMPNTKISFNGPTMEVVDILQKDQFPAKDDNDNIVEGISAGFSSNGKFYPIKGWIAYAKESYRDDLMAGIRIYCRGKIAAQTAVFNRKSGFTGENTIRSYLVGEIHADWLDREEDLILTDRRDILWSHELASKFETWGQNIVTIVGKRSLGQEKKRAWKVFLETGKVKERVNEAYPGDRWKGIRDKSMELAKLMGERLRLEEAKDKAYVNSLVKYSLTLGPHVILDYSLKQAASQEETAIEVMATILRTARVAELSSYGMIAEKRVKVIERINTLKDEKASLENELQKTIEEAPWLINPFWSPITANKSLSTIREEFEKFFHEQTGNIINLTPFEESVGKKRPDFVLSADDSGLQIIEIKRPKHKLVNNEWDRIQLYIDEMGNFLENNKVFKDTFKKYSVTLVCDEIGLSRSQLQAFKSYEKDKTLEHITWRDFLFRTRKIHKDFLDEAERQKKLAVKNDSRSI